MQQKALGVHLPEEGQALPSHALERGQVHGLQEEDLHPRGGPVLVDRRQEEGLVRFGGDGDDRLEPCGKAAPS